MVSVQSKVRIVDNSGVKLVKCIHFANKVKQKSACSVGSVFLGVVLDFVSFKKSRSFKKGNLVFCLVLRSKKNYVNVIGSGFYFKSKETVAVLCKQDSKFKQYTTLGTRFFGPVHFLFKENIFVKENYLLSNCSYESF